MGSEKVPAVRPIGVRYAQDFSARLFDPPERPRDLWISRVRLRPIRRGYDALDPSKMYVALGEPDQEMLREDERRRHLRSL
jgi:hypothetical protein